MKKDGAAYKELGVHLLWWIGYYIFEVFAYVNYDYTFFELTYLFFLALPAKVLFIYPTLFWTVHTYFFRKKYFRFVSITFCILLVSTLIHRNAVHYGFLQHYRPEVFNTVPLWDPKSLFRSFEFILTIGSMFIAFGMVRLSYQQYVLNNQLVTANISAELKNLKEQIKPHFLFNTLNNLYGLTKSNPQKASEVVMRLSQLMNYMLYCSNHSKVNIRKEIDYLQDYLELEKIRYGDDLKISFQAKIVNENFQIAPLLLQPFIENAFKHGISKKLKDPWLQINVSVIEGEMIFKVVNAKPEKLNGTSTTNGIGIANVQKRLDLLYPQNHRLKLLDDGDTFLVSLVISDPRMKNLTKGVYEDKVPAY